MILTGESFNSGDFVKAAVGTHPCVLLSAEAYLNNKFQSDELQAQVTLVWDTETIGETDSGEEVDILIFDSFINLSLNEKATLTKRLKALVDFDENTCKLEIVWDGEQIKALTDLPHRTESKKKINDIKIDGVSVFGKPALVAVELNDKGYNKVTSVSKPLASAAKRKVKAEPAAQDDIPV